MALSSCTKNSLSPIAQLTKTKLRRISMSYLPPSSSWPGAVTFVSGFQAKSTQHYIKNIDSSVEIIKIEEHYFPVTRNEDEYQNSYVCSPYTAYISYARDELDLINSAQMRSILRSVIWLSSGLLKLARINKTVSLNNWLFSTSLVPNWEASTVNNFTNKLMASNPNYAISIRSLNRMTNTDVIDHLVNHGWKLMPARQVYIFNHHDHSWWKRNNVQNDQRLLRKTELQLVLPHQHQADDFIDMEACFNQLYIDKHSEHNPQYTHQYFEFLHANRLIEFFSFRDKNQKIVATMGLLTQQDTLTAPIVGYNTDLPKSLGLYRLLMAQLLKLTWERGQTLNLSSGAGEFKRNRGGVAALEYTAIYSRHLPIVRKTVINLFAALLMKFAPGVLHKNKI